MDYKIKKNGKIIIEYPIIDGVVGQGKVISDGSDSDTETVDIDSDYSTHSIGAAAYDYSSYDENNTNNANTSSNDYTIDAVKNVGAASYDFSKTHYYEENIHTGKEEPISEKSKEHTIINFHDNPEINKRINIIFTAYNGSLFDENGNITIDLPEYNMMSEDQKNRFKKFYEEYKLDLSDEQIAALLGNMRQEEQRFNPEENTERLFDPYYKDKSINFYDSKTGAIILTFGPERFNSDYDRESARNRARQSHGVPGAGGMGLMQWTRGSWSNEKVKWVEEDSKKASLLNFANEYGGNWWGLDTQLLFSLKELGTKSRDSHEYSYDKFMNYKYDINGATAYFCEYYEQPGKDEAHLDDRRIPEAKKYYEAIKNSK